jgi:predicted O-methyltransferase YrrM
MDFLPHRISEYSEMYTSAESPLLYELNRQTHIRTTRPRMLSGHMQGRFLAMLSHWIKPQNILEIGTFTGYSALCMAEGLTENGTLITIDNNPETNAMARQYFEKSAYHSKIQLLEGNALEIIPTLNREFDIVFIDADKENYEKYYEMVIPILKTGGTLIADNVLWSGKVVEPVKENDKETIALKRFNETVNLDPRVENILLPLRDGLMIARKV